jgi:exodeoxyribonuclease V alpha subunit
MKLTKISNSNTSRTERTENRTDIRGKISKVIFSNKESGYAVLVVALKQKLNGKAHISVTGIVPNPVEGATIDAQGRWEFNEKYGQQFRAEMIELSLPNTKIGMEKYLIELDIKGVGPARAQKIVNAFGKDTYFIIEHQPERLVEVPGVKKEIADNIVAAWKENQEGRKEFQFLAGLGVGGATAQAIWRAYKTTLIPKITNNPYILADIDGIGFKKADTIALRSGISPDAPERIKAALLYVLFYESRNHGHVFLPKSELVGMAYDLFDKNISESKLVMGIAELEKTGELHIEESSDNDDQIYLKSLYVAEKDVASCLGALLQSDDNGCVRSVTVEEARKKMRESMGDKEPSEKQVDALVMAANNRVSVITGGPGTGKTTIIKSIVGFVSGHKGNFDICLAAPTGRAAKRMEDSTGVRATTIHRLLEYSPDEKGQMIFRRNAQNPLESKRFIVDEMSMTDLPLMHSFLQALPHGASLLFVGDADQLPSVGPGNVLHDLIASGVVPVCKLDRNFRQQQDGSAIIDNAHRIIHGEMPVLNGADNSDFKFIEIGSDVDNDDLCEMIVDLVKNDLPKKCGVSPLEIQVLSPMNKREPKVDTLNAALQKALNPPARFSVKDESGNVSGELKIKNKTDDNDGVIFRVGDKVMQRRNNYNLDVYNGDVGIIKSIDHESKIMVVDMGVSGLFERNVSYDFQTVQKKNEMSLAYASTIHKAQGSEYPVVIMPVVMPHYIMLRRSILYTGVTRGKEKVVLVGTKEALRRAVENAQTEKRFTNLAQRIVVSTVSTHNRLPIRPPIDPAPSPSP